MGCGGGEWGWLVVVVFGHLGKDPVVLKVSFLSPYLGLEVHLKGHNLHGSVIARLGEGNISVLMYVGKILFKRLVGGGELGMVDVLCILGGNF